MPHIDTIVDIDLFELIDSCNSHEIDEICQILENKGKINKMQLRDVSALDDEWNKICSKLNNNRLTINNEDEEIIRNIVKKLIID